MKLDMCVLYSHYYCADSNYIIFKSGKRLKVYVFWQKLANDYIKIWSWFRWGDYTSASEFIIWIRVQNLADRLILSAKMKNLEKSTLKRNIPSSFVFQIETSGCGPNPSGCTLSVFTKMKNKSFFFLEFCIIFEARQSFFLRLHFRGALGHRLWRLQKNDLVHKEKSSFFLVVFVGEKWLLFLYD